MKFSTYIFLVSLTLSVQNFIHAEEPGAKADQFLALTALSKTKVQMMQNLDDHLKSTDVISNPSLKDDLVFNEQSKLYKDRKKAFFRSLIVPGAGEYYLGKNTLAKTFFITEIALWLSYFGFREYSKWIRDDALAFAATHSGAHIDDKPSQFYVDIGNYDDVYQYNDAKQRFFQFEKVYTDEDYFWAWDTDANRREFENMRIASDQALNRSVFILGGIFANHIISAIHSVWQANRYNKKLDKMSTSQVNFNIETDYSKGNIIFSVQKKF